MHRNGWPTWKSIACVVSAFLAADCSDTPAPTSVAGMRGPSTLALGAAPSITVSKTSVAFTSAVGEDQPTAKYIDVSTGNGQPLGGLSLSTLYGVGEPTGWLTATLQATVTPTKVKLRPSRAGKAGVFHALVKVRSSVPGVATKKIDVTYDVGGWMSLQQSNTFRDYPPSFIRVAANNKRIVAFYGFVDPALPILDQAEAIQFNGTSWSNSQYSSNNAPYAPDVALVGSQGFGVIYDTDELDVRGGVYDAGSTYSLGPSALENQTDPSVAQAYGTIYYSYIINGRAYTSYNSAHAGSSSYPKLNGDLGQTFGSNTCVLTLNCILSTSLAGTSSAFYIAMGEYPGCISVERVDASYTYLDDCFHSVTTAFAPQMHIRGTHPMVVFREGTGSSVIVGQFDGTHWQQVGALTVSASTFIRSAVYGSWLLLLRMSPDASAARVVVYIYDGSDWFVYPTGIETSGSTLSDVDVSMFAGTPVIGLIQNGHVVIRWLHVQSGAATRRAGIAGAAATVTDVDRTVRRLVTLTPGTAQRR